MLAMCAFCKFLNFGSFAVAFFPIRPLLKKSEIDSFELSIGLRFSRKLFRPPRMHFVNVDDRLSPPDRRRPSSSLLPACGAQDKIAHRSRSPSERTGDHRFAGCKQSVHVLRHAAENFPARRLFSLSPAWPFLNDAPFGIEPVCFLALPVRYRTRSRSNRAHAVIRIFIMCT